MASSSFKVRKITTNRQNSSTGSDCYFIVNRSPVTPKKRDVSQFEDYRQRAFVQIKRRMPFGLFRIDQSQLLERKILRDEAI